MIHILNNSYKKSEKYDKSNNSKIYNIKVSTYQ